MVIDKVQIETKGRQAAGIWDMTSKVFVARQIGKFLRRDRTDPNKNPHVLEEDKSTYHVLQMT